MVGVVLVLVLVLVLAARPVDATMKRYHWTRRKTRPVFGSNQKSAEAIAQRASALVLGGNRWMYTKALQH